MIERDPNGEIGGHDTANVKFKKFMPLLDLYTYFLTMALINFVDLSLYT